MCNNESASLFLHKLIISISIDLYSTYAYLRTFQSDVTCLQGWLELRSKPPVDWFY